jgi:hypothetical protein
MGEVATPSQAQILAFCAEDPVERVFLEEMARRRTTRFAAVERGGKLAALAYLGTNAVPSGEGCDAFADLVAADPPRMLIGDEGAVTELWEETQERLPVPREDRPGQPVFAIADRPEPGGSGLRPARKSDLDLLLPACAAAHEEELGANPLAGDGEAFRRRTLAQIEEGRSWLWAEDGAILFKAEASAWTPSAVQLQQVWVDPGARNQGHGRRGLSDLCSLLLDRVQTVCLFVRRENVPAIRLYEAIGMRRAGTYRSVLF